MVLISLFEYSILAVNPVPIECNVDNGGCSDICNPDPAVNACECPSCFRLMADEKTCEPDPKFMTTTCSNTGMQIIIDGCDLTEDMTQIGFHTECPAAVELMVQNRLIQITF